MGERHEFAQELMSELLSRAVPPAQSRSLTKRSGVPRTAPVRSFDEMVHTSTWASSSRSAMHPTVS